MDKKKKVAIIGTNGIPARYGGFETLSNYLVEYLSMDFDITVYCSRTSKQKRLKEYKSAKLLYFPLSANGWQSIPYDIITIFHAYFKSDNLIILGLSGAFAFPFNKIFKKNIIFNIGGIEWQKVRGSKGFSKIEIRLKKWMEKICIRNSKTVIIDNLAFKEYLIKEYRIQPVLAEYGGDNAVYESVSIELLDKYPFLKNSYDLSVSRAQEDMNIHIIIETYKLLPNRSVVIISNWDISSYGKKLYSENNNKYPNIILLNAIYDQNILNIIRSNCSIYIHTHSLCGTAPSLVEAMSLNLPVISYDIPTNRATTENKALYFKDTATLIEVINSIEDITLLRIKEDMLEISKRRYTWKRITSIYKNNLLNSN